MQATGELKTIDNNSSWLNEMSFAEQPFCLPLH